MKSQIFNLLFILLVSLNSCRTVRKAAGSIKDDGKLEVVLVQVNDVYEIAPLEGGKSGGMARVASLTKQYDQLNKNTLLVIAGDFVSPSVFNSLQYNGKRVRGKQMIEAMNAAGMDLAIFGNHEFDITEAELQERINESDFQWIASNTFHAEQEKILPFEKVKNGVSSSFPASLIMNFTDSDGTTARIGFMGITLPFNKASYVSYTDPLQSAKELYAALKDSCDAVVAITHQTIKSDIELAGQIPGLALILGGHEHDMRITKIGNVYITKAHANAKSAYVVKLIVDKNKKSLHVIPELKMLDESVQLDSLTNMVVKKWMDIGNENFTSLGFDVKRIVFNGPDTLEGRESEIRKSVTNLTKIITAAMADACPEADIVLFNAGSVRIDDILPPPVTEYDIIRTLPFGGGIRLADMKGKLVLEILQTGQKNTGSGGYLQYQPVFYNAYLNSFSLSGKAIDPEKVYKVALSEFLLLGLEANLGFLTKNNPGMVKIYDADIQKSSSKSDIRLAVIRYLLNITNK